MNPESKFATSVAPRFFARSLMGVRILLLIAVTTVLNACGGGGGAAVVSSIPISISGRVIDGYINGATVFWDCNANGKLDADEVSTITGPGGRYNIAYKSGSCDLLAEVPGSAIDEDYPGQPVGIGYTLATIPEKLEYITPFTTLAYGHLKSGAAKNAATSNALIVSDYGLQGDVLTDYKVANSTPNISISKTAEFIVAGLKTMPIWTNLQAGISSLATTLKSKINIFGVKESMAVSVTPFIFENNAVLAQIQPALSPNPSNIVLRASVQADLVNNDLLDRIAKTLTDQHAADYGFLNFGKLDDATLKGYVGELFTNNVGSDNAALMTAISSYKTQRQSYFRALSDQYGTTINDETAISTLFTNDPLASADAALSLLGTFSSATVDIANLSTGGLAKQVATVAQFATFKQKAKRIKYFAGVFDKGMSYATCGLNLIKMEGKVEAYLVDKSVDLLPGASEMAQLVLGCVNFADVIVHDLRKLKKHGSLSKALKAIDPLVGFTKDIVIDGTDTEKNIAIVNVAIDFFDLIQAVSTLTGPAQSQLASFLDFGVQFAKAYITGLELEIASSKVRDANVTAAEALYKRETQGLMHLYHTGVLSAFSSYWIIVDSSKMAYVTNVTAAPSATASTPTSFTITGQNLPLTAVMSLAEGTCQTTPTARSATGFTVVCTPGVTTGSKLVTISTATGGTVIDASRTITVTAAPPSPVCTLPKVLTNGACVTPAKPTQTITFNSPGDQTIGVSPPTLTATSTSSLKVTLTSATPSICTVNGSALTLLAIGNCTIAATQAGDANYAAATPVSRTFTVAPAAQAATPMISSLSTTAVLADGLVRTLTIYGDSFTSGNVVKYRWLNPVGGTTVAPISVVSASQMAVGFNPGKVDDTIYVKVCLSSQSSVCSTEKSITVTVQVTAPTINVSPQAPSVLDNVTFWLTGAYQAIKSVVWSFGAGVADLVATVANGISTAVSQAFDTSGAKTVTATYKDSTGTTLGTVQTNVQVQQEVVQKTAAIAAVKTDTGVVIPANTTVVSTKPVISGTTSAALTNTEVVLVYDGTVVLGRGTVTDTSWTYSATTPLAAGVHSFTAVVARADGLEGTPSATYLVTISGTVSSPSVTDITPQTATASTPTSFTITGQNLPLTAVMALAGGTCQIPTLPSATGFTVVCTPGSSTGSKIITISTALSGGAVIDASKMITVASVATPLLAQTITFENPPYVTLGVLSPFTVFSSSNLSVTLTSSTPSVCTVSGFSVTTVAVGICTLNADQAGNSYYAPAARVIRSVSVFGAIQTITFDTPANITWGSRYTVGATSSSNLLVAYTSSTPSVCTISGISVTLVAVGTCTVNADQDGNSYYAPAARVTRSFSVIAATPDLYINQAYLRPQFSPYTQFVYSVTVFNRGAGGSNPSTVGFRFYNSSNVQTAYLEKEITAIASQNDYTFDFTFDMIGSVRGSYSMVIKVDSNATAGQSAGDLVNDFWTARFDY